MARMITMLAEPRSPESAMKMSDSEHAVSQRNGNAADSAPVAARTASLAKPEKRLSNTLPTLRKNSFIKGYRERVKLRTWLYTFFAMTELVMMAAFLLAAMASTQAVKHNYKLSAMDAIGSVHAGYMQKIEYMSNSLKSLSRNSAVQIFLQNGGSRQATFDLLKHLEATYQVESIILVDPEFKTLLNGNSNVTTGAVYNPAQLLDAAGAMAGTGQTVWSHSVISYAALKAQQVPLWRGRQDDLDEAYKGGHPFDYEGDSLIRYVAIPIVPLDLVTWAETSDTPIGYAVMADLANGKSGTTSNVASTLGGAAGIHHRVREAVRDSENMEAQWITASSSVSVRVFAGSGANRQITHTLVEGFSPLNTVPDVAAFKTRVFESMPNGTTVYSHPYMVAARPWRTKGEVYSSSKSNGSDTGVQSERPQLLMARGIMVDRAFLQESFITQATALVFMVALDLIMLVVTITLFILPLERMVKLVRAGKSVDINRLEALSFRRYYTVFIAAIGIFSLLVGAWLKRHATANLMAAVYARASVGPGNVVLSYRRDLMGLSRNMAAFQLGRQTRGLLEDQTDTAKYDFMLQRLRYVAEVEQIEFIALINSTGHIIVYPDKPARKGEPGWDPANMVGDTLATGNSYVRTSLVNYSELQNANAPVWEDVMDPATSTSDLRLSSTNPEGLVRWSGTPIWIDAADHSGPPDGMIIAGHVVNGKGKLLERASKMILGESYSAIYYCNSDGEYVQAAGMVRSAKGVIDVDVPLSSTKWLDRLRKSTTWMHNDQETVTVEGKIRGERYFLSARCAPTDTYTDQDGTRTSKTDYSGAAYAECSAFLIQGIPYSAVQGTLIGAYVWQGIFILFCCLKLLAISVICYRAYVPFKQVVIDNQFVRQRRRSRLAHSPISSSTKSAAVAPSYVVKSSAQSGRAELGRSPFSGQDVQGASSFCSSV